MSATARDGQPRRPGIPHATRDGSARADADGVAVPDASSGGTSWPPHGARLCRGRQRHRRVRAGDHGGARRCRGRRGPGHADGRRRPGRAADRRLVDARQRADLRPRRRRAGGPGSTSGSTPGARSSSAGTATRRPAASSPARYGDVVFEAPIVLEGGSLLVDGQGTPGHHGAVPARPQPEPGRWTGPPSRTPSVTTSASTDVVWLGPGLVDDRDTDGHIDVHRHLQRRRPAAPAVAPAR